MDYFKTFNFSISTKPKFFGLLSNKPKSSIILYKSKPWICNQSSFFYNKKNKLYNQGIDKRKSVKVYAQSDNIDIYIYYITKMTFLFTFFYCSLQWFYYRRIRKDHEVKL
jgi:hypothetical protein